MFFENKDFQFLKDDPNVKMVFFAIFNLPWLDFGDHWEFGQVR